jgi:hypothetical protein
MFSEESKGIINYDLFLSNAEMRGVMRRSIDAVARELGLRKRLPRKGACWPRCRALAQMARHRRSYKDRPLRGALA